MPVCSILFLIDVIFKCLLRELFINCILNIHRNLQQIFKMPMSCPLLKLKPSLMMLSLLKVLLSLYCPLSNCSLTYPRCQSCSQGAGSILFPELLKTVAQLSPGLKWLAAGAKLFVQAPGLYSPLHSRTPPPASTLLRKPSSASNLMGRVNS